MKSLRKLAAVAFAVALALPLAAQAAEFGADRHAKLGVKCEAVYYDSNDHAFWNVKPNDPFRLRSWNDAVAFFDKILKKK